MKQISIQKYSGFLCITVYIGFAVFKFAQEILRVHALHISKDQINYNVLFDLLAYQSAGVLIGLLLSLILFRKLTIQTILGSALIVASGVLLAFPLLSNNIICMISLRIAIGVCFGLICCCSLSIIPTLITKQTGKVVSSLYLYGMISVLLACPIQYYVHSSYTLIVCSALSLVCGLSLLCYPIETSASYSVSFTEFKNIFLHKDFINTAVIIAICHLIFNQFTFISPGSNIAITDKTHILIINQGLGRLCVLLSGLFTGYIVQSTNARGLLKIINGLCFILYLLYSVFTHQYIYIYITMLFLLIGMSQPISKIMLINSSDTLTSSHLSWQLVLCYIICMTELLQYIAYSNRVHGALYISIMISILLMYTCYKQQ